MAKVGASNAHYALFVTEENAEAMPSYKSGFKFGALMEANDNPNYTSGDLYGDDALEDSVDEFVDADIDLKACKLTSEDCAKIFGIELAEDGTFAYPTEGTVPFGALGYIQTLRRRKEKFFRAFFFPKVKPQVTGDSLITKGQSISFDGESLKFKAYKPLKSGVSWKYKNEFPTLPEAITWLKEKLNIAEPETATETPTETPAS